MANTSIYQDIAARTGGNIYIGVVGPVRTGKSTFIKRFMEQLVLPNIDDPYRRERARDELPQSGSGRTIMTAEPKFVPEEAVTIAPEQGTSLSVRLIDSVGYLVEGAMGATEDGQPRMVTTPWFDREIPMEQAAELGTRKVMEEHCTVGILITTDGTVTDLPRAQYSEAERRAVADLRATGKPFVVLVNSTAPEAPAAQSLCTQLRQQDGVCCLAVNCLSMGEAEIRAILQQLLLEFPLRELQFFLPGWLCAVGMDNELKRTLYAAMRRSARNAGRLCEAEPAVREICQLESVAGYRVRQIDLGTGTVACELQFPQALFYDALSQEAGCPVHSDRELFALLRQVTQIQRDYEKVAPALQAVRATGYGIVMPQPEEMQLERPELVKKGGSYGIKLRATAPSIHMMRADILTEISPTVGDENQSQTLVQYMQDEFEQDTEKLWQSNIFGKSVFEMVSDGFDAKLHHLPDDARLKLKNALSRIVNEGAGGLICILL